MGGSSKGAAFVTFADANCARNAADNLQDYYFEGATRGINVKYASSTGSSASLNGKGGVVGGRTVFPPGWKGKGQAPQATYQKGMKGMASKNWQQQMQPSFLNNGQQMQP